MRFTMERLMLIWIFVSSPKTYEVKINSVSKLTVTGGTECSSGGRAHYKSEVAGSNPAFPIPYSGGIRRRYCGSIGLNPQLR